MTSVRLETELQQLLKDTSTIRTSRRTDCPSCGGKNTFSVTNLGTLMLFYCFKASCKFKGKRKIDLTIDAVESKFRVNGNKVGTPIILDTFLFIPELISPTRIRSYLYNNNCWEAYREGRADIRFDPYEDRVVFMIYEQDTPVAAIGRSLVDKLPKWKRYGKESKPFICAKDVETFSKTLVIVEDCCSACAASMCHDSAALLGTHLQAAYLKEFLVYDKFILALDKDASKLAFKLQKELQYYRPTKILLLEEDLKGHSPEKVRSLFNV